MLRLTQKHVEFEHGFEHYANAVIYPWLNQEDVHVPDRIFYSWQSDCPSNTNRSLILTAIEKAIESLKKEESTTIDPVIDRDTLGLAGSPDISQSIFSKIDEASIFICDVSIINGGGGRTTPNPNVLIELGYAVKSLGWHRVIMVMNSHFGKPEDLPFDLRSKRVLTYSVASEAEEKAPIRNALMKTITAALKAIFENHGSLKDAIKQQPGQPARESDKYLFEEFKSIIPSKGSISFIDEQNMAGFSWPAKELHDLKKFYYEWNDAEHEFLDNELELLREKLHSLIGDYLGQIATNTFPANNPERQTVPPEWEEENPKMFFDVVNKLHETAGQIVDTHQALIRAGRKALE